MTESLGSVLAPLADRYAHWLGLNPAQVLADRRLPARAARRLQAQQPGREREQQRRQRR